MRHYGITISNEGGQVEDRLLVQHLRFEEVLEALATIAETFGEFGQAKKIRAQQTQEPTSIEVVGTDRSNTPFVVTFAIVETV